MMTEKVDIFQYDGQGMAVSYSQDNWVVGIKNYKPASDPANIQCLERHLQTDELFIPLTPGNVLIYRQNGSLRFVPMEIGRIYAVGQGTWHNVLMRPTGKLALTERAGTSMDNSETDMLSPAERAEVLAALEGV